MKLNIKRLAAKVASVGSIAVVVVIGTTHIGTASALTQNGRYYCGSTCNTTSAYEKVAGQGFACADDRRIQATGTPTSKMMGVSGFNDPNLKVTVYYSHRCQTIWARVTNTRAIGRSWTVVQLNSTLTNDFKNYPFPLVGTSVVTGMIDDHSPTLGIAAAVDVEEQVGSSYSRYYFSY